MQDNKTSVHIQAITYNALPRAIRQALEEQHVMVDFQIYLDNDMYAFHIPDGDGCMILICKLQQGRLLFLEPYEKTYQFFNTVKDIMHNEIRKYKASLN